MKKILDFIFEPVNEEDDEEVIVEAPIVKHSFSPKKEEHKAVNKNIDKSIKVQETKQSNVQKDNVVQKQAEAKKNDVLNKKPTFGIEVDNVKHNNKTRNPKVVEIKTFKAEKKYEFQPPMSPIFGVLENHKDTRVIVENNHSTSNHAHIKSHIGTVLSPIYGTIQTHDEEIEVVVDDIIEDQTVNQNTINQIVEEDIVKLSDDQDEKVQDLSVNDSFKEYFEVSEIKDEDIENTSIDDILIKPQDETYIFNRDISLFDDEMDN